MRGNSVVPLEQRLAFVRVTRLSPVQCLNTTQKNGGLVRLFTGVQVLNAEVALSIRYNVFRASADCGQDYWKVCVRRIGYTSLTLCCTVVIRVLSVYTKVRSIYGAGTMLSHTKRMCALDWEKYTGFVRLYPY